MAMEKTPTPHNIDYCQSENGTIDFPQWEVIATQRRENGFTVITTVGMESIPFTGEWVGGNFHNGKSQQPSVERMGSL